MKLTWGELFWPSEGPGFKCAPLDRDLTTEILIIGAGITGALIADALLAEGIDVVIVDKREPGRGSTGASTALLVYELDTPLQQLMKLIGREDAGRCYHLGVEATQRIEKLTVDLQDDCGFVRRKSLYLCRYEKELEDLKKECELRREQGLSVDFLGETDLSPLFSFNRPGAILSHDAASVDPYRLTLRLLGRGIQRGVRSYGTTDIAGTRAEGNRVRAFTLHGPSILARKIIYATGYEAAPMIGENLAQAQITYAIASQPLDSFPGWWEQCLIWETSRPYLYLRTTADGCAMIGGLDDPDFKFLNDKNRVKRKAGALQKHFSELFPSIDFQCDAAWAGVFETTPDGLPYIGPHPRFPNCYFALGYGGNGMTFSVMAAEILRDLCIGKPNRDARLFRFDRSRA